MEQTAGLLEGRVDETQPLGGVVDSESSQSHISNDTLPYPVVVTSTSELQLQPLNSNFEGKAPSFPNSIAFQAFTSEVITALQAAKPDGSTQGIELVTGGSLPTNESSSVLPQDDTIQNVTEPSLGGEVLSELDSSQQCATSSEEHRVTEEVPNVPSRSLRTKRSFTTEFKLECVEHAERTKNKTKTAKLFNVNRRRVQEWCTQKDRLMSVPRQQKRLSGGGRRQIPMSSSPLMIADNEDGQMENKDQNRYMEEANPAFGPPPQGSNVDPAFVDFIVQNLPSMDFSTLPSSMVKIFQDWSKLTSQGMKMPQMDEVNPNTEKVTDVSTTDSAGIMETSETIPDTVVVVEDPANPPRPLPVISEQFDTEDEIDVGQPVEMLPSQNLSKDRSMDVTGLETGSSSDVIQSAPSEILPELSEGEQKGEQQGGISVNNQELLVNSVTETDVDTSQIDPKVSIDISSITNWIQENAMDNVPAILDALMQAQAVSSSKPVPVELNEESMDTASSTDEVKSSQQVAGTKKSSKSVPRARVKNRYTLEFKLDCIAHAESTSKCAAAREFNVDRRRVQDWCSKKDQLRKMVQANSQSVVKLSRERIDSDVEQELVAWVKFQQEAGVVLNRKMLGEEATKLYHEKGETDFVSSVGWVAKFMVRNNISLVGRSLRINPPSETASSSSS